MLLFRLVIVASGRKSDLAKDFDGNLQVPAFCGKPDLDFFIREAAYSSEEHAKSVDAMFDLLERGGAATEDGCENRGMRDVYSGM